MPTAHPIPLSAWLADLESAVAVGDRAKALELARQIQQRLATEAANHSSMERQVRALLAELDAPTPTREWLTPESLSTERGMSLVESEGMLYPVWFGTNRKPTAD